MELSVTQCLPLLRGEQVGKIDVDDLASTAVGQPSSRGGFPGALMQSVLGRVEEISPERVEQQ
jgi:hypothetical protein